MRLGLLVMSAVVGLSGGAFADTTAAPPSTAKKVSELAAPFTKIVVHEGFADKEKKSEVVAPANVKAAWEALGTGQQTSGALMRCPDLLRVEFVVAGDAAKTVTVGFCAGIGGPARVSTGAAGSMKVLGGITVAEPKKLAAAIGRGEPENRPLPPS